MNRDTIKAIKVLKSGTLSSDNCRQWDNCFENGNGNKVVKELSELVKHDYDIAQLVLKYSNFMPVAVLNSVEPFYIASTDFIY